jgi:Fur family ferric uptake transcriptional regulator
MTVAPRSQPLEFRTIDDVADALRRSGSRLTTPRRLVLEVLFASRGLASAEQIAARARVDLTSAYRNLERLEELGVVRHVHVGHGPSVYGLVGDGEREFLVCESCGKVVSVDPSALERVRGVIRDDFGLEARFTHFPIHGRCADCR